MEITQPQQLTGPIIRGMRNEAGLTQQAFWGPLGVTKSRGSSYEKELHKIDEPVQLLVYLFYVCKMPVNLPHDEMLLAITAINSVAGGADAIKRAIAIAEGASDNLKTALKCMEKDNAATV